MKPLTPLQQAAEDLIVAQTTLRASEERSREANSQLRAAENQWRAALERVHETAQQSGARPPFSVLCRGRRVVTIASGPGVTISEVKK